MTRLVQIQNGSTRRIALVEEPNLRLLDEHDSVYALACTSIATATPLTELIRRHATGETLAYEPIYEGKSPWRLLVPVDHPAEPSRCLVSGTGLTHLGSAKNRQAMHAAAEAETDSMRLPW